MIKFALNTRKLNNYAFFCPVSRLHLTVSNPVGFSNEVTTAILKALKANTVLDVDGVVDIETGTVKAATNKEKATPASEVQKPAEEKVPEEPKKSEPEVKGDDDIEQEDSKPVEEKGKKGGKKAGKTADAE